MNSRVHIANLSEINPVISAARRQDCFVGTLLIKVFCAVQLVRPQFACAYPVALPTLHGAPRRGTGILLTRPLVIAASEFIEHARTDPTLYLALMEQVIDDCRKGEAGAGAFRALVKDLRHKAAVDDLIRQCLKRRMVWPIPKINLVRKCIQRLADLLFDTSFSRLFTSRWRFRPRRLWGRFPGNRSHRLARLGGRTFLCHCYSPIQGRFATRN